MGGLHVKYHYNISDHFRIQPSLMLNFGEKHTLPGASVDVHYLFGSPKVVRPYVAVGFSIFGYEEIDYSYYSGKEYEHELGFGPNFGLGLDWRISHSLSIQLEAKGVPNVIDDDCSFVAIALGLSYNF